MRIDIQIYIEHKTLDQLSMAEPIWGNLIVTNGRAYSAIRQSDFKRYVRIMKASKLWQ